MNGTWTNIPAHLYRQTNEYSITDYKLLHYCYNVRKVVRLGIPTWISFLLQADTTEESLHQAYQLGLLSFTSPDDQEVVKLSGSTVVSSLFRDTRPSSR